MLRLSIENWPNETMKDIILTVPMPTYSIVSQTGTKKTNV